MPGIDDIKTRMFASVDYQKPAKGYQPWWDVAWTALRDAKSGPVVAADASLTEQAIWLLVLRHIQSLLEMHFWGRDDYDPLFRDHWETTGLPWSELIDRVRGEGHIREGITGDVDSPYDEYHRVSEGICVFCTKRHDAVFDAMMRHCACENSGSLMFVMLGGRIPKNEDAVNGVGTFVGNGFHW